MALAPLMVRLHDRALRLTLVGLLAAAFTVDAAGTPGSPGFWGCSTPCS